MLALSVAGASLPVVGKHLEPLGGMTAMGVWGARHAPEAMSAMTKDWLTPGINDVRRRDRESTHAGLRRGAAGVVSAADLDARMARRGADAADLGCDASAPLPLPPRRPLRGQPRAGARRLAPQGSARATRAGADLRSRAAPGCTARSMLQGSALMSGLAEQGWVCLAIDYRVAPHHRWPRHITDVKTAIAWARANVDKFGGDRNFVAVAGCSAGGHLSALAGLTPDDPQYEAKLPEGADSSVDAVVGIYGRYDWEDRSTPERARFVEFLERVVVRRSDRPSPRGVPRRVADRARASECAAVLGDSRQQGQRHPGRAGAQLCRAVAGGLAFDGRLPGVARRGPRLRPHRR